MKGSLAVERDGNRYGECKVIGVTLETRPDTIVGKTACGSALTIVDTEGIRTIACNWLDSTTPPPVIKKLRSYGCTRVQMGIQHLDDEVLRLINRGCDTETAVAAILLLKEWGYKIDAHWMPNLPGCSPELDRWMFLEMLLKERREAVMRKSLVEGVEEWKVWFLEHPELQVDQWKIYPCEVVPYTEIEKWYKEGKWAPYGQEALSEVLMETKRAVFPWIRLNRVVRDIPSDYIMASGDHPSLRQELLLKMKKRGWECRCIRCREIKGQEMPGEVKYRVHEYGGEEYFVECIGLSNQREVLCGFLRLRLGRRGIAWIRELHVYGQIVKTTGEGRVPVVQSQGIGRRLVEIGLEISRVYGYRHVWVIAGEGTKCYYERLGFREGEWGYMVREV